MASLTEIPFLGKSNTSTSKSRVGPTCSRQEALERPAGLEVMRQSSLDFIPERHIANHGYENTIETLVRDDERIGTLDHWIYLAQDLGGNLGRV